MDRVAFNLYLVYCMSFFVRFPARYEFLSTIRFDLILVGAIAACLYLRVPKPSPERKDDSSSGNILTALIAYIALSLPFVEWPGSVVHTNSLLFLKAILFYYFSVTTLTSERRVVLFMAVFVGCQVFRVLEPLYLHHTIGYWGSFTHMGGSEFLDRLSGAPADTVNPNGLAFVIVSVLPFLHYFLARQSLWKRGLYVILVGALLYVLILTASRSGMVALGLVATGIMLKSKHKILLVCIAVVAIVIAIGSITDIQKDRYLSTVRHDVRGGETSKDRWENISRDFDIAMNNPIFGHGLGTSTEAITNVIGYEQISHNLFTEILQELGIVGLVIYLFYIGSIFRSVRKTRTVAKSAWGENTTIYGILQALHIYLWMNLIFSVASYGLSTYQWYLFGGLAVVLTRLTVQKQEAETLLESQPTLAVSKG